jgi:hypothetical protein
VRDARAARERGGGAEARAGERRERAAAARPDVGGRVALTPGCHSIGYMDPILAGFHQLVLLLQGLFTPGCQIAVGYMEWNKLAVINCIAPCFDGKLY